MLDVLMGALIHVYEVVGDVRVVIESGSGGMHKMVRSYKLVIETSRIWF